MEMEFILVEVEDSDYELIQNLIRFYIYDMSEFTGWSCPSNGLYGGVDDQPYYYRRNAFGAAYRSSPFPQPGMIYSMNIL